MTVVILSTRKLYSIEEKELTNLFKHAEQFQYFSHCGKKLDDFMGVLIIDITNKKNLKWFEKQKKLEHKIIYLSNEMKRSHKPLIPFIFGLVSMLPTGARDVEHFFEQIIGGCMTTACC